MVSVDVEDVSDADVAVVVLDWVVLDDGEVNDPTVAGAWGGRWVVG